MNDDQIQFLQNIDWGKLLVRLNAYATALVKRNKGWMRGNGILPGGDEAEDCVQEAIKRLYDGTRKWKVGVDIEILLKGIIRSYLSSEVKGKENLLATSLNTSLASDFYNSASVHFPEPESEIDYGETMAAMVKEILKVNDEKIELVFMAMTDGIWRPSEISEETGIPVAEVYNLKKRILKILGSFQKH